MSIHVVPIDDLQEHVETGAPCCCRPKILWDDAITGERLDEPVIVHNSADGRELVERHGVQ